MSFNNGNIKFNNKNNKNTNNKTMKYKFLDKDFNLIYLQSRFTLRRIRKLMEIKKDKEEIYKEFDEKNNDEYNNNLTYRKGIKVLSRIKKDKDSLNTSEKTIKKIKLFKKWQKNEICNNKGMKNYFDELNKEHENIYNVRKLADNRENNTIKIALNQKNKDTLKLLPTKKYNNSIDKDIDLLKRNQNLCGCFRNYRKCQKSLKRNKSIDEMIKNNISIYKNNKDSIYSNISLIAKMYKPKNKRNNSIFIKNKKSSLIKYDDNSTKRESKLNNSKEKKSIEDSIFIVNKSLEPLSHDKSFKLKGKGCLYVNSIFRNKNINDIIPHYSYDTKAKMREYTERRKNHCIKKSYLINRESTFIFIFYKSLLSH